MWEFIIPGVSSLVGAGVGSWLTLRRFKDQQLFETRLSWYARALRTGVDFYSETAHYRDTLVEEAQQPNVTYGSDVPDEMLRAREEFFFAIAEGGLHLDGEQYKELEVADKILAKSMDQLTAGVNYGGVPAKVQVDIVVTMLEAIVNANSIVRSDGRRLLGRPRLPSGSSASR